VPGILNLRLSRDVGSTLDIATMVKLFVIIGLIAAVAAADTAIKFEDADGSACIIRKDGEKLSFISDGSPSSNVHCDIGVNGANGGHRVGSALDALYDRVGNLEQAVSALQVAPPPSLSSMVKLEGWACAGGDSILQAMADTNCPGFQNKDMTEIEAVVKCNECADCHGIFASKADLSNWYYCGKKDSNGLSTTYASRGVWSDYWAYFKADPYDQSDLCTTGNSYSPMTWQRDNCSPASTTTSAALLAGKPPMNMVKLRGFACGGGGGPLQAQADFHCPGFQNTMSEQAATDKCNDCDDCHGIFSHDGPSEWHYCGKSHGDYAVVEKKKRFQPAPVWASFTLKHCGVLRTRSRTRSFVSTSSRLWHGLRTLPFRRGCAQLCGACTGRHPLSQHSPFCVPT
jgi:hypothetical protein